MKKKANRLDSNEARRKPKTKTVLKLSNKREYNNSSRQIKADQTQKHIIETYIDLLAKKRGGEVHIDELAKFADVSQRTVFRFFKDKKALHEATDAHIQQYVHASLQKLEEMNILEFTRNSFNLFEKYENMVMAYMFSPYGVETRSIFRKRLNKILIDQILASKKIKLTKLIETRLAVIVTLINVKVWYDIRSDFKYSTEEIGSAVSWCVEKLIKAL